MSETNRQNILSQHKDLQAEKAKTANNSIASLSSIAYKNLSSVDGRQSNQPNSVIVHRQDNLGNDQDSDDVGSYKAFSTQYAGCFD